jgi:predicted enzyme related to lactoylglutathione lyase
MAAVTPGRFIWHELLTTHPDAAIAFYQKVVGWNIMAWDQDPGYRMFTWNGAPMAGVMLLPDEARQSGAPSHWLSYVSVRDVDQTLMQAVRMGAMTYLEPMEIPTVGRLAVMGDPQGATFGIYEPVASGPAGDAPALGDFSWHELAADDWKTAWEFYHALFGWEYDTQFELGPWGTYWMFRRVAGSRTLGGMFTRPKEVPHAHWLPYIHVASAHRAAELAAKHAGRVVRGPLEVPGGDYVMQAMDPQGAVFAVHAVPTPAESKPPAARAATGARKAAGKKPAGARPAAQRAAAAQPAEKVVKKPVKKAAPAKPAKRPVKKSAPRHGR